MQPGAAPKARPTPPPRRPLAPGPEFVTSPSGSGAFRALNPELFLVRSVLEELGEEGESRSPFSPIIFFLNLIRSLSFIQKPTGFVRRLSFAGTAVALGVVAYWVWETEVAQKAKKNTAKPGLERRF